MKSEVLDAEIRRLQAEKHSALDAEARERCKAIFGTVPDDYDSGTEEMFGNVARVYVLRAYNHADRGFKLDHEWIRLWHEYAPDAAVEDLIDTAWGYVEGGCGVSG